MNNEKTNRAPHRLFTMKQHNTIPGNQVAVYIFVREEDGRRNVIQQLQKKKSMWRSKALNADFETLLLQDDLPLI